MRVSIAELESCVADPARWVRAKLQPGAGGQRFGYKSATRNAIYRLHASGDPHLAREHLRRQLERFRNDDLKARAEADLEAYIRWFHREVPATAAHRVRLRFDLGEGVTLGGEVSRVDVTIAAGGYRAILLGTPADGLRFELRWPVMQRAIARMFDRQEEEVHVGVQALDGSGLLTATFGSAELDAAEGRARRVASALAREWLLQGGP